MSQKASSNAYFSEPEDILNWEDIPEGSSDGALVYLKMAGSAKRKRNSDPKSFPNRENRTGRRRKQRDNAVDDIEQCAKRMKCMSLQNAPSRKMKEPTPSDIDAGYEGDCEA